MSSQAQDDEAAAAGENIPEYKVGEKKTIEEYHKLDENDESLRKWKESLGIGAGNTLSDPKDPRTCIIESLGLEAEGRPDITIDLRSPGALEKLKRQPIPVKEGAVFHMKVTFKVQHHILSGLKYVQTVKKMKVPFTTKEPIGSYSPNTTDKPEYKYTFKEQEAPKRLPFGNTYDVNSKFVDDDKHTHLEFDWSFKIEKNWA